MQWKVLFYFARADTFISVEYNLTLFQYSAIHHHKFLSDMYVSFLYIHVGTTTMVEIVDFFIQRHNMSIIYVYGITDRNKRKSETENTVILKSLDACIRLNNKCVRNLRLSVQLKKIYLGRE